MAIQSLKVVLIAIAVALFASCSDSNATSNVETTGPSGQPESKVDFDISTTRSVVKFKGELFNIPSPIQTIMLIKKSNVKYDEELLSGTERTDDLINETQKALNLGVMGADLAYLSNFERVQASLTYLQALEGLASDLDISDNIDREIIARFSENIGNRDSLYILNAEFYRAGYRYLKENERNNVASLILLGGWVEALHYALNTMDESDKIKERVAEQGTALKSMLALMSEHKADAQMGEIMSHLNQLNDIFQKLETTYTYVEPITDRKEKKTYFNSQSNTVISDQDLMRVKSIAEDLRNLIIA